MTWKFWVIKLILVVLHVMTIKEECLSYMGIFGLTLRGHHRRWVWINMVLQLHLIFSPLLNPNSGFWVESKETNLIKRRQCFFVMIQQISIYSVCLEKNRNRQRALKIWKLLQHMAPNQNLWLWFKKIAKLTNSFFGPPQSAVSMFNVFSLKIKTMSRRVSECSIMNCSMFHTVFSQI